MAIRLIAGIGNIGSQYIHTRHNLGHAYIKVLAETYNVCLAKNDLLCGYIGILKIQNFKTYLLIPNSYVNNSGVSISICVKFYQLSLPEVLIVHDELDLSPGSIRIKLGKRINSSHRGIKDIISKLNNNFNFYRLKIGIGRPNNKNDIINFVLSQPSIYEKHKIDYIIKKTILHTENIISNNFTETMNELHSY